MTGEIEFFRKRFVGGFNREDVVNYISKLAQERNEYREAKEKAEQDIHALNDYIAALRIELDAAKQEAREGREYKVAAIESAIMTFAEIETAFENLCRKLDTAAQGVCAELEKARDTVTALPSVLAGAGDGIKKMQEACKAERDAAVGSDAVGSAAAGSAAVGSDAVGSAVTADSGYADSAGVDDGTDVAGETGAATGEAADTRENSEDNAG